MDIRKLQRAIVDALEDVKGQQIVVFNTEDQSPLFERVIVASGTSNRQTKALAASVRDAVKALGIQPRLEGEENGEWIIVDCGAAVLHVMQPAIRDYYHLEEIWGIKPVRMKMGGAQSFAAASSSKPKAAAEGGKKPAASRMPAARKSAPPAKKVAAKKALTKSVAKKKPAAKTVTAKKMVVKKAVAAKKNSPPAKKARAA